MCYKHEGKGEGDVDVKQEGKFSRRPAARNNIWPSKQSAESKQTAELIKYSKFSFQTYLLWALSALEVSKWLIWVL